MSKEYYSQRRNNIKLLENQLKKFSYIDNREAKQLEVIQLVNTLIHQKQHIQAIHQDSQESSVNLPVCKLLDQGFIIYFNETGKLIYVSSNSKYFIGVEANKLIHRYVSIWNLVHPIDRSRLKSFLADASKEKGKTKSILVSLHTSKRKSQIALEHFTTVKITGHSTKNGFIGICLPYLNKANREDMKELNSSYFFTKHDSALNFSAQTNTKISNEFERDTKNRNFYKLLKSEYLTKVKELHNEFLNNPEVNKVLPVELYKDSDGSTVEALIHMKPHRKQIHIYYQLLDKNEIAKYLDYKSKLEEYQFTEEDALRLILPSFNENDDNEEPMNTDNNLNGSRNVSDNLNNVNIQHQINLYFYENDNNNQIHLEQNNSHITEDTIAMDYDEVIDLSDLLVNINTLLNGDIFTN